MRPLHCLPTMAVGYEERESGGWKRFHAHCRKYILNPHVRQIESCTRRRGGGEETDGRPRDWIVALREWISRALSGSRSMPVTPHRRRVHSLHRARMHACRRRCRATRAPSAPSRTRLPSSTRIATWATTPVRSPPMAGCWRRTSAPATARRRRRPFSVLPAPTGTGAGLIGVT